MEVRAQKDDAHGSQMEQDEWEQRWASIERLPSFQRLRLSLMEEFGVGGEARGMKVVNVIKLTPHERKLFVDMLLKNVQTDNLLLLEKINARLSRVDMEMPTVEVRYKNLNVHATCKVLHGKPLPTIWNSAVSALRGLTRLFGLESKEVDVRILKDVSGIIKPSRLTLLLGPPGSGKTTLLLALSGRLSEPYQVRGDISYNGFNLEEFNVKKTSAYISQYDVHIPEMTVRETLDFSARCQGVGSRMDIMKEVLRKEKQAGVIPDFQIDTFMKAISTDGSKRSMQTDYILKILGLENCSDTTVGDAMLRGISGGQKRRLTTGEIIVGPARTLFMDEISTGLDSSTTFQVVSCLQQMVHITKVTALVSLLQPAPETFNLFDDIIMMAEGRVIYHGPCNLILDFFKDCGFKCPERKDIADFLQEVTSKKDQEQYWCLTDTTYSYVTANEFAEKFKSFHIWNNAQFELSNPMERSLSHKKALSCNTYSLTKWEIFKTCMAREYLLMKKDSFVYIFKITQITIVAWVTLTTFLRTNMGSGWDLSHANYFMGSLFYAVVRLVTNGIAELTISVSRLQIFYKQRDLELYPAWAYSISASILKIPFSLVESSIWTLLTYYAIGYSPEVQRFFCHLLLLVALHLAGTSLFRFLASISRTYVTALFSGDVTLLACFLFSGFIIPRTSSPSWLLWGFWLSPLSYAQIGLSLNEFSAPRWQTISQNNTTIGEQVLRAHGLNFTSNFYWISVLALFTLMILFNIGFTIALTFLKNPATSKAVVSQNQLHSPVKGQCSDNCEQSVDKSTSRPSVASIETNHGKNNCFESDTGRTVLPFVPMTITFQDLQYYIDTPKEIKEQGFTEKKHHLLQNITGACRPGVLTALMGVSGSGKTTLMDVLFGRKTCGTIEGDIRVGGYPKVQETFARISGYCEQNDIHSPQITVEESVIYSAWLRLTPEIDQKTKRKFVTEVLELIELDGLKDALVGVPGVNGLSTEQRKRLTIAVELVANPSIIFMDEPTSGLDARAAAIVMRAVKNITETGRTIVCTIHQPSINIFESFDELILLRKGGRMIYFGPLGQHSSNLIQYFESIPGVPKIEGNYNPATWMLEVTSSSMEQQLGVDFAQIYEESSLYQSTRELVKDLSTPSSESKELHFTTQYPQNEWGQFKACLWKQNLSYWRRPTYNLMRLTYMILASLLFAVLFRNHGKKINEENDVFAIMGLMYLATTLIGAKNCSTVVQIIAQERAVLYREKYAGMYSSLVFSLAQVIIEVPYMFILTLVFVAITYPAIGYYWSAYKVFWYFYATFCTLLYYNYLGMLAMSLCPTASVAAILCSACYTMLGLFSGFIIPKPQIPKWWVWFYWICPSSWTLKGYMISQYGDITKEISAFGEAKALNAFLKDYYGFHQEQLGFVALVLFCFPFVFASLFAVSIAKMNFQRR